ncbi:MAG: hypothetical protein JOS17DRAFT_742485 [Linnemannia elongata]|nr:MAG: hypothetical protein JOS17DRAFT_742485 [Linnemannia elongata]
MRISWALQVAAVFCLVAVHPAVADSSSSSSEEQNHTPTFDRNPHRIDDPAPVFYKRATDSLHIEIIEDHIANNYARTGGLQFRRRGDSPGEHERPRGRPGPSRSETTDVPPHSLKEHHLEHEPKRPRPDHLTAPGKNHHPKPTHKPGKPDHGKPGKPDHGKPGKPNKPGKPDHKPKPKPNKPKPKPSKTKKPHKPTHTNKPKPKPKPATTTTTATVPTVAPVVPPQPPVVPTTTDAPVVPTPPAVVPPTDSTGSPVQNLPSGNNGSPNGAQPTSGLNTSPGGGSMSGSSSSSIGTIIGAVVGSVALAGLVALGVYRRRERQRAVEEATGPNPEMDEAPRTAFRHESFMALVKDAAQGFYAPGTTGPAGGPGPHGPSGLSGVAVVGAGAGTGANLSRQTSARSQNSQHSLHSRRSGQFSAHGMTPSSPPPPLAHIGGR